MTTTGLHDLVTSAGDDGTMHPAEQIWAPDQDPAVLGFTPVLGDLHITGLPALDADAGDQPALFVLLGHHRWATTIHAAALYMQRVHAWTRWCLYPATTPTRRSPHPARRPHARRHPLPPRRRWNLAWARRHQPGALQITAMRHPAAPAAASALPDPDRDDQAAAWAR